MRNVKVESIKRNTLKTVAACAAVAGLAVGCCSVVKPGYDTLIAHRGESVDAPENTLPAYKTAVERGWRLFAAPPG